MTWTQVYDPTGMWWLSTLVALLPVVVLLGLLVGRVKPHLAALAGAAAAMIVASLVFRMPWSLAFASLGFGVAYGLLKIAWIVVSAVFLYDITVYTGQFEIMKQSIARITADRRLQALLVAFCFGAFIEGAAGFGAPVAIAGAFMIGLGFKPFHAAALNLIANTAPVAWGAIGTPVHALATVTALPEPHLSAMIGRILPLTAIIVPFWIVRTMVGWSETIEVLPAILVVGGSFAITQFAWSNFVDSNLVDIAGGAVSIAATIAFLKVWQPKRIWRFKEERDAAVDQVADHSREIHNARQTARAWMPFAVLTVFVLLWGLPSLKTRMNLLTTPAAERNGWDVPLLHQAISRDAPVVATRTPEAAKFDFNWLTATGSGCFLAALVSGLMLGLSPRQLTVLFWRTLVRMRFAVMAISFMLGLGFVTRYSGLDAVLGLAFTRTGVVFPFFGAFLGWLGVALTGSDTSSNVLFGGLQRITAEQLKLNPVLMCAANSAGGVMGKMVDAQSIVVATAATNQVGNEGVIFRFVFWHSIALAAIVGLIVMAYAYLAPGWVP
ncbi:MAG: lactate permease [Blastocatellia bacterium AA13]|nr:MAG: lactate permease [Blastocatellia bacterium AA13]